MTACCLSIRFQRSFLTAWGFVTDFWAFVFGVRFWLHEFSASVFNCIRLCDFFLFEHSFSTFVFGLMSFCDWFLYERSNLVWWRLISATKGCISQCCLPFCTEWSNMFINGCIQKWIWLFIKSVPSSVPSSNKGLDSSGVNETPICNKSWGSTLPCHSRRSIC